MIKYFLYIPEACDEIFNIGADQPYSVNELAEAVGRAFGVKPQIRYLRARNEVLHAYADHHKARNVFDSSSGISLEEGIHRMAQWAKKCGQGKVKNLAGLKLKRICLKGGTKLRFVL